MQQFLQSRNINQNVLREVESLKPGAADQVMKLAAHISLGKPVQRPRFGIMGSIVRRLRLFQDPNKESLSQAQPTITNNYQAPVQVFNGPVFFGAPSNAFDNLMNKRPREQHSENMNPKRRLIQTKEESFFN